MHQPLSFTITLTVCKENVYHRLYEAANIGFNFYLARRTRILSAGGV